MAVRIPAFLCANFGFTTAGTKGPPPIAAFHCTRANLILRRCSENGASDSNEVGIWGMVEELLNKEENKGLLAGLEQASERVEIAKRELAKIQEQETEALLMREYVARLESRAAEVEKCQREISEAKAMLEEAEVSLKENGVEKDAERLESVKAASVSGVIGTLAQLPLTLARASTTSELIIPLSVAFVTCALFGVTYRYAIRNDLDNSQLKLGTAAAFSFTKGLGMLQAGPPLELESSSISSHGVEGLLFVSESLVVFLFAGVALDLCIKLRIINPLQGFK